MDWVDGRPLQNLNADALENSVFNLFGDWSQAGAGGLASYFPGMSR